MSEIIWYLFFSDWLISLTPGSPGSSILSQRVKFSSFSCPGIIPLCKCPIVVLSTHLLMDTWAASISWRLYITLQWTQTCLCSFELVFWVPSDIFPEVQSLGQKAYPFIIFWGISILLSTMITPVCIPTNSAKVFPFLHILTSTCCLLIYWW